MQWYSDLNSLDADEVEPVVAKRFVLPRLVVPNGTIEALKWLALLLMTGDHVDKYLFNETIPALFAGGRLAMPLFGFVLAYNLARPNALARGSYGRTIKRLALFGLLATPGYIALGGLWHGWWPLNIMFTLLAATVILYVFERTKNKYIAVAAAGAIFLVAGSAVEFWWPALVFCIAAWAYCKRPSLPSLVIWIGACASLWVVNGNWWALAAMLVIFAAPYFDLKVPRFRYAFYAYYPAHLLALLGIRIPMSNAGYLFFT